MRVVVKLLQVLGLAVIFETFKQVVSQKRTNDKLKLGTMSKNYMWQLTMPEGDSPPIIDAGDSVKNVDPALFRVLVGKTLINLGNEMVSDVALELLTSNAVSEQPSTALDDNEDVAYE